MTLGSGLTSMLQRASSACSFSPIGKSAGTYRIDLPATFESTIVEHSVIERVSVSKRSRYSRGWVRVLQSSRMLRPPAFPTDPRGSEGRERETAQVASGRRVMHVTWQPPWNYSATQCVTRRAPIAPRQSSDHRTASGREAVVRDWLHFPYVQSRNSIEVLLPNNQAQWSFRSGVTAFGHCHAVVDDALCKGGVQ